MGTGRAEGGSLAEPLPGSEVGSVGGTWKWTLNVRGELAMDAKKKKLRSGSGGTHL